MAKIGRNDPCFCGSGKKYKKCCLTRGGPGGAYTKEERVEAIQALGYYSEEPESIALEDEAYDAFWGDYHDAELGVNSPYVMQTSKDAFDAWFAWDRESVPGRCLVDLLLEDASAASLSEGARAYLQAGRGTCLRIYEVTSVAPGASITLRDMATSREVTVHEKAGSRTLKRWDVVAARVFPMGASGQPEVDGGFLSFGRMRAEAVRELVRERLAEFRRLRGVEAARDPGRAFWIPLAPALHQAWIACWLPMSLPELQNTDGEALVLSRTRFELVDREQVVAALERARELSRGPGEEVSWSWFASGKKKEQDTILGRFVLGETELVFEANSEERTKRGRAFIERRARGAVRHLATTLTDLWQAAANAPEGAGGGEAPADLPLEVVEKLVLKHYDEHYRGWLDEGIPALGGATPREAAGSVELRPALVELLKDLEHDYTRALTEGKPAYDSSWMWEELGLAEHADAPVRPDRTWRP